MDAGKSSPQLGPETFAVKRIRLRCGGISAPIINLPTFFTPNYKQLISNVSNNFSKSPLQRAPNNSHEEEGLEIRFEIDTRTPFYRKYIQTDWGEGWARVFFFSKKRKNKLAGATPSDGQRHRSQKGCSSDRGDTDYRVFVCVYRELCTVKRFSKHQTRGNATLMTGTLAFHDVIQSIPSSDLLSTNFLCV